MDIEYYWLWLNNIKGIGYKKKSKLLKEFGSPLNIWNEIDGRLDRLEYLTDRDKQNILYSRSEEKILSLVETLNQKQIKFYSIEHKRYPNILKNIFDPPFLLYVRGELLDEFHGIGVVGARKATEYGKTAAFQLSKELVEHKFTVISGMARGIDTYAHKGALKGKGNTIAVLGCGVDVCYPRENIEIMNRIIEQGAVISEFAVGAQPKAGHFPLRNRIISGLSEALVVIEAAERSGSLITADQALEQGRDVFAVPGSIYSVKSKGTNHLLKQGAKVLTSYEDIINEGYIPCETGKELKQRTKQLQLRLDLDPQEQIVYDYLSMKPIHPDEICRGLDIPIHKINGILTILELKGMVRKLPDQTYIRNI